ncbi:MAG: histidine kinase N-terminal 7TM domain-containing protein [Gemmatimonadaceae bacterium]
MRLDVLYLLLIILCVLQLATLATLGWRARRTPGGRRFAFFCATGAAWSSLVGAMAVTPPETARVLLSLKYGCIALGTVSLFLFVCQRTGRLRRLSPTQQRAFFLPPLAGAAASARDTWGMVHAIEWERAHDLTYIARIGFGPVYWLFTAYGYALIIASIALLVLSRRDSARLPRAQSLPMLVGVVSPLITNVLLIAGITPRAFDPMPLGLAIAGSAWWWGAMRHQILDLVPVARHALVDALDDGILILDAHHRILDLNDRLASLCKIPTSQVVGTPIDACPFGRAELRDAVLRIVAEHERVGDNTGDLPRPGLSPASAGVDGRIALVETRVPVTLGEAAFELRSIRFPSASIATDVLVLVLHDVTAQARLELEQRRLIGELRDTLGEVRTLRGLLPICAGCKQIRDDSGTWHPVEQYVRDRTHAEFSHGMCPACVAKWYPNLLDA